jgi:hypothetical protein
MRMRALWALPGLLLACSTPKVTPIAPGSSAGGSGGGGGSGTGGTAGAPPPFIPPTGNGLGVCPNGKCSDFPTMPIIDQGAPADAASKFSAAPSGAGPCIWEPEDRTMFPQRWLRPRFRWTGTTGLHRITIHTEMQDHDLVVYTTNATWTMPKDLWDLLAGHVTEKDISVTIRAAAGGEATIKFQIAPVSATGSMVFWSVKPDEVGRGLNPTNPNDTYASELRGFAVGDESTVSVLKPGQVMQTSSDEAGIKRHVRCIGCHVATPDDGYVAFVDDWPWNLAVAGVKPGIVGQSLPGMSQGGLAALNMPWGGMMSFSKAQWNPGKRLVVLASSLQDYMRPWTTNAKNVAKLVWYNLDAPPPDMTGYPAPGAQFGEIARQGDASGAACPTWSHDGATIVYSSTSGGNADGALQLGATDLYSVPFNDGMGGPAKPIAGAAEPAFEEYYPAYSPDDSLVIYTRVARGERMYANKLAEIAVVPSAGGKALRLDANDPPACTGRKSPGVNNHWAKWAPTVPQINGRSYYWLLFSSDRSDIPPVPRTNRDPANTGEMVVQVTQLYMSLVVKSGDQLQSYPAVYLWNQPTTTANNTPIWEQVAIPVIQ